jgi:ankyrin repeat protein
MGYKMRSGKIDREGLSRMRVGAAGGRRVLGLSALLLPALLLGGCTSLQKAARTGNVASLAKALDKGKDVNALDHGGSSLVVIATTNNQLAVVRELIGRRANLEIQDALGRTPLFIAANANLLPVAQELVAGRAVVDSLNTERRLTPLMPAAERGYKAMVEFLLSQGANPFAASGEGDTPLLLLSRHNLQEAQSDAVGTTQALLTRARALLKNDRKKFGAFLDARDRSGFTAVYHAALAADAAMVQLLLQNGANPNLGGSVAAAGGGKDVTGWTPLHGVAQQCRESEAMVRTLLAGGAQAGALTSEFGSVLAVLAGCREGNQAAVARLLLDKLRSKSPGFRKFLSAPNAVTGWTTLNLAIASGQGELAQLLLKEGANPDEANKDGVTPLYQAVAAGDVALAAALQAAGANSNQIVANGESLLHLALQKNDPAMVKQLLADKANPNLPYKSGASPLYVELEQGRDETAALLLAAGANPNVADARGRTPLHLAAAQGKAGILQQLLRARAGVNARQASGASPLFLATGAGHIDAMKLLLAAGANPEHGLKSGTTPLAVAVQRGNEAAVELLLAAKARPRVSAGAGPQPVLVAAAAGQAGILKRLLAAGVKANEKDDAGFGLLHFALEQGSAEVVAALLEAKADPNQRNGAGVPPLLSAVEGQRTDLVRQLLNAGADPNQAMESDGTTPLHAAAALGSDAAVLLVNAGASSRRADASGMSPSDIMRDRARRNELENEARNLNAQLGAIAANLAQLKAEAEKVDVGAMVSSGFNLLNQVAAGGMSDFQKFQGGMNVINAGSSGNEAAKAAYQAALQAAGPEQGRISSRLAQVHGEVATLAARDRTRQQQREQRQSAAAAARRQLDDSLQQALAGMSEDEPEGEAASSADQLLQAHGERQSQLQQQLQQLQAARARQQQLWANRKPAAAMSTAQAQLSLVDTLFSVIKPCTPEDINGKNPNAPARCRPATADRSSP